MFLSNIPFLNFLIILILNTFLLANCKDKASIDKKEQQKEEIARAWTLLISVSIAPQAYLVNKILSASSTNYKLNVMIDEDENPHIYIPSPKQIESLKKSSIYVKLNVPHFAIEERIDKIILEKKNIKTINMSKGIKLIDSEEGEGEHEGETGEAREEHEHNFDSHIWLSLENLKISARNIYTAMSQIYPDKKIYYERNFNSFVKEIEKTKAKILSILSNLKSRYFLIYHPALGYFASEFNLKQRAISKEGKEPSIQNIAQIASIIKESNIKTIFVQKGFNLRLPYMLAGENKLEIKEINPLSYDVLANLENIAQYIKDGAN